MSRHGSPPNTRTSSATPNLNRVRRQVQDQRVRRQGQFSALTRAFQFDEAIISNLKLNFVVFSGGEAASPEAFKKAEANREWSSGYFWEPQYLFADVPLKVVKLPPHRRLPGRSRQGRLRLS